MRDASGFLDSTALARLASIEDRSARPHHPGRRTADEGRDDASLRELGFLRLNESNSEYFIMGYSLAWLAIKGKTAESILAELELNDTGEREELFESKINGAQFPDGWYLVIKDHEDCVAQDAALEKLTFGCEAVTCSIEEHCMYSSASGWKNGVKIWSVTHDSQKRRHQDLQTQGTLPEMFSTIRDELSAAQAESDRQFRKVDLIFDIPVSLAAHLTGFRYDRDTPGLGPNPFAILEAGSHPVPVATKKPWWKI